MNNYCNKYNKTCEEALKFNCTVPSDEINIDKQLQECKLCVFYNNKKTNNDILTKDEDLYLMGQQDMVYRVIETFLKTDLAVKANITGIDVRVENGYVNASWKFGELHKRFKGDIKETDE